MKYTPQDEIEDLETKALFASDCFPMSQPKRRRARKAPLSGSHYMPEQLGELWCLSADTIRRLFEYEPGVLVIERQSKKARRYRTLRIPQEVADRVQRRLSNPVKV
jgi:hypothetical protein